MSIAALAGGLLFYVVLRRYAALAERERVPVLHRLNGAQAYENSLLALYGAAAWLLRWTATRRLQLQLLVLMAAMVAVPLLVVHPLPALPPLRMTDLDPLFALLWLIGAVCALGAAYQAKYHRLVALILAGGTGVVTSLTFLWMSAPDLALTQLMVETVTTVLILLGLRWLPPRFAPSGLAARIPASSWLRRGRDGAVAVAGGLGLAVHHQRLLRRARPARGRRRQRRQCAAGRLPRLRHDGRDHGAVHRCPDGVRAAAPLPSRA
jgi:multicomponent K+:H+ antiporter subunit A